MDNNTLEGFTIFFGLAEGVGALSLILLSIWLGYYRGGFAWTSNPSLEFNWHPLLMSIAMIFMYANSMMVYRAFRNNRKKSLKLTHTAIHLAAFILAVIGLQAVFDSHNLAMVPIPNMYSLHSWVGLTAVILFACQWVAGLVSFLYPTVGAPLRAAYMPVHIYFGLMGFGLSVTSALLGLSEKAFFALGNQYSKLQGEAVLINIIGVTNIIFAALVVYITAEPRYKRQPLPEDEMLLSSPSVQVEAKRGRKRQ